MLIKQWSGNETSEVSLKSSAFDDLYNFYSCHSQSYIYGRGKIGNALAHYLKQSSMTMSGFVVTSEIEDFRSLYVEGETGVIIGLSDRYLQEVLPLLTQFADSKDIFILPSEIRENIGNHFSLGYIEQNFWLNVFVTNSCNLNCRSCSTFAPICQNQPEFYNVGQFLSDLEQFKKMGVHSLSMLKFTGGEPFLHPQLLELLQCGRKVYPDTVIECYTNGLMLGSLEKNKIERLKELNINLVITEYPLLKLSLDSFYTYADKIGLSYNIIVSEGAKYFSKRPLNFNKSTPKYQFANCPRYKMCDSLFLFKGKLYKCIYTFASAYINKAFDKNLQVTDSDFLKIKTATKEELFEFCRTRIPFCGYCEPISELVPWGFSERKIEEWS